MQAMWENPLDVIPLMTEEDKQMVAEKKEKGREAGAIKAVARRFEDEKVEVSHPFGVARLNAVRALLNYHTSCNFLA